MSRPGALPGTHASQQASPVPTVLSIQSHVAFGHVGNAAAVPALQRLGVDVVALPTAVLSNHAGYPTCRGRRLTPEEIGDLLDGVAERGVLGRVDAVLSGYLGTAATAGVVLDAVTRVRAANPDAFYACDPVIGDAESGPYVATEVADALRENLIRAADVVTPNAFELSVLTGMPVDDVPGVLRATSALRAAGPRTVLVTSVPGHDPGTIAMIAADGDSTWIVTTPRLSLRAKGTGDLTAALFVGHLLLGADLRTALGRTAAGALGVIRATVDGDAAELRIVAAGDEIVRPRTDLRPSRLRGGPGGRAADLPV
jgi:pyridoxine kinase